MAFPEIEEISDCLSILGIKHVIEYNKAYPKDFTVAGRIKF